MKKYTLLISFLLTAFCLNAQPPKFFKYQGIARDSTGNPVSNDTIALRISIHQSIATGTVVYRETHAPVTNEFGSFNINIGGGAVVSGNFSTIAWGRYNYFQEVEMDITGGSSYVSMGTSQYLSVPYALAADSAKRGIAPFWVQNNLTGNDTASVAIIAIANGDAPAIFAANNGSGDALSINGRSSFEGEMQIDDTLYVNGGVKVNGSISLNGVPLSGGGFSNFQVFNSAGTFTVPAGVTKIMVEIWGAGGGGGGGGGGGYSNFGGTGGGGAGGGYVKDILTVVPGQVVTATIGQGGTGGGGGAFCPVNCAGAPGSGGGNGGTSSFATATAGGGGGGAGGQGGQNGTSGNPGTGGEGGNAPGILGIVGQFGFGGNEFGFGGSSPNGSFGGSGGNRTPGGGGSGGRGQNGNGNGGNGGGNGRVIVWW